MNYHKLLFILIAINVAFLMIVGCNDSEESNKSNDQIPKVDFSFQANNLSVTFQDNTHDDGSIVAREWDFGDDTPLIKSQSKEQEHLYNEYKSYDVTLKVTDDKGQTGIFKQNIILKKPIGIINVQQNKIEFGKVYYGSEKNLKIFIQNTGNDEIKKLYINSYPDNDDFTFTLAENISLTPNERTELKLNFSPKSLGEKNLNIIIGADNHEIEPKIIKISGTGISNDLVINIIVNKTIPKVLKGWPVILPIDIKRGNTPYECIIDWGDTHVDIKSIEANSLFNYTHTYSDFSDYEIDINITDYFDQTFSYKQLISVSDHQIYTNTIGMNFIKISAGVFMMGSPYDELGRNSNETLHEVTLTKDYYIQSTEITKGQWRVLMGSDSSDYNLYNDDDYPVDNITWEDAQEYIEKLNQKEGVPFYRLPTEAEWEYAARAGTSTALANGDISVTDCEIDFNLNAIGWYCGNSFLGASQVAQKQPNEWGLFDMHGNVWEWCSDWAQNWLHGDYDYFPVTDPTGPIAGSKHVNRGGSWFYTASNCRSAQRTFLLDFHLLDLGARLAFTANAEIE